MFSMWKSYFRGAFANEFCGKFIKNIGLFTILAKIDAKNANLGAYRHTYFLGML